MSIANQYSKPFFVKRQPQKSTLIYINFEKKIYSDFQLLCKFVQDALNEA